jgi:hypothetical protein
MNTRKCFVISPIGEPDSEVRENADAVLHFIIEPALADLEIEAVRADRLAEPGLITHQMVEAILTYDLCIADLTGHNPNVFYELAIAQAVERPIILMKQSGESMPFDVKDYRRVDYDLKPKNLMTHKWVSVLKDQVVKVLDPAYKPPPLIPNRPISKASAFAHSRPTASSFFLSLDDKEATSFPNIVRGAAKLQIMARTVVNLIGQYRSTFAALASTGSEVQLLIVDPASESANHLYGDNSNLYHRNALTALSHLANLQRSHGDRIRVRFFSYVPTLSIVKVERPEAAESFAQVQFYFARGDVSRDKRPVFRVDRSDPWYDIFCEEFDSIWKAFPDVDVAALLAKQRS